MALSVNPIFSTDGGTIEVETLQAGGDIDMLISPAVLNGEESTPADTCIKFSGPVSAGGDITLQVLADADKAGRIDLMDSLTAGGNVSISTLDSDIDIFVWHEVAAGGSAGTVYLETGGSMHLWLASRISAPGDATLAAGGLIQASSTALIIADNLFLQARDTVGAVPGSPVTVSLTGVLDAFGANGVYVQNQGGLLKIARLYSSEGGASVTVQDTAGESDFIVLAEGATIYAKKDLRLAAGDGITLPSDVTLWSEESLTIEIDVGANDPDTGPGTVIDFTSTSFDSPVIRIQTGSDDDVIRVNDLAKAGTILDISTGAGDDKLLLGDTSHVLSFMNGSILFDGGAGTDSVSVDNSSAGVIGDGTLLLDTSTEMPYLMGITTRIRMSGMGDLWYLGVEDIDIALGLTGTGNSFTIDIEGTGVEVQNVDIIGTGGVETFRVGKGRIVCSRVSTD